ncbi:MAG: LysM repeat protein [Rhodothermales bacterium]|jgi:LysM repeat protein
MRILLTTSLACLAISALSQVPGYPQAGPSLEQKKQWAQFKNEILTEVHRQRLSQIENAKMNRELWLKLSENMETYAEVISQLRGEIKDLKTEALAQKQQDSAIKEALNDQLGKMRRRMDEESTKRSAADERLLKEFSSELSHVLTQLNQTRTVSVTPNAAPTQYSVYSVEKGDTLSAIAQAFGVSMQRLIASNGLRSHTIHIGQKLKVPVQ